MKKIVASAAAFLILASVSFAQDENPLLNVSPNPGLCSIFHKWGFIGDSLSSGEFEYIKADGKKGYYDAYEYSWGQRMCALMGTKGDNYSTGGETAYGWIRHFWDKGDNHNGNICAKDDPKQAYVIALGVNDMRRPQREGWEFYTLGDFATDVDMNDYNKNADTFIGCYAGIIQRVKSIQPRARFFVVTMPQRPAEHAGYNEAVRKMAEIFENVYVIDLDRYASDQYAKDGEWRKDYYLHGHLSPAGYEYTAWMFLTYIDWIIRHDMESFKDVGFVGNDRDKR